MAAKLGYEEIQTSAFSTLVKNGTYSSSFDHSQLAQEFFSSVISSVLHDLVDASQNGIGVLDCGCGNGSWLDYLTTLDSAALVRSIHGFDLTPEMVEVAATRLAGKVNSATIQRGNILDATSYSFPNSNSRYDLVFTYDVVQQLPVKLQFEACMEMVKHLTPCGFAVIFDHDSKSEYGRSMARKKFFTRYLGLRLVPRYYCNAHYPPLREFANRLALDPTLGVTIKVDNTGKKQALIIQKWE